MADQATNKKRKRRADTERKNVVTDKLTDDTVDFLMPEVKPLTSETLDQQRRKLQVIEGLEDFNASFSRGYAVILSELAKRRGR